MKLKTSPLGWAIGDLDTHIGKWVEDSGKLQHDEFLIPLACTHIKEGSCVIDAGSNIGSHTIAYSSKVGKEGTVIAIEPGKVAFECLLHNVGLFPHNNVMPIKAALSDQDGQTVSHTEDANLGASTCNPVETRVPGNFYLLTVTIDFIASQIQKPISFIKLDIEGWETDALIGASKTLRDHKPILLIEVNKATLEAQGSSVQELLSVLHANRYVWSICQPNCSLTDPMYDILALPSASQPLQ